MREDTPKFFKGHGFSEEEFTSKKFYCPFAARFA
jgi:hypothetical protein